MKIKLLFLLVFAGFIASSSATRTSQSFSKLQRDQEKGVVFYQQQEFESAYKELKPLAELGMKKSQYFLGFLYLKGQHVEQSTITGLAWIGVATEVEIEDWQASYDQIFNLLPKQEQQKVLEKKQLFIEKYGMGQQEIDCKQIRSPARTKNKKVWLCQKHTPELNIINEFSN